MDTAENTNTFFESPWAIYLLGIVLFFALFFIQKYIHLLDRKLSSKINSNWEGTPWPLLCSLGLGFLLFLFGVFLPGELNLNPTLWYWPEIIIAVGILSLLIALVIESVKNLGRKLGITRSIIYLAICIVYFYTGLLAGLFIAVLLSLAILIYFLFFWKKRLKIN